MPLYPRSVASQGTCRNSISFHCFHLRFTFESIKELGNVSSNLNKYNKGMISKLVPLLNGLVNLVIIIGCTTNGDVFTTMLLILISMNIKFNGLYLKSRKEIRYAYSSNW
jgi:hypothetical protein